MTQRLADPEDYVELKNRVATSLPVETWPVRLRDGVLRYVPDRNGYALPKPSLLREFIALAAASDERIFRFARRHGPLALCEHRWPMDLCRHERCGLLVSGWWAEPKEQTEDWRRWARRFEAVVTLARELQAGQEWNGAVVKTALNWWSRWSAVEPILVRPRYIAEDGGGVFPPPPGWKPAIDVRWKPPIAAIRRSYLAVMLRDLLTLSRVRREVVIVKDSLAIVDGSRWLFGVLVNHLAAEVVGVGSVAICADCRRGFHADRVTARFCSRCRRAGKPLIYAQRARRERLRAQGRTSRNRPVKRLGSRLRGEHGR